MQVLFCCNTILLSTVTEVVVLENTKEGESDSETKIAKTGEKLENLEQIIPANFFDSEEMIFKDDE